MRIPVQHIRGWLCATLLLFTVASTASAQENFVAHVDDARIDELMGMITSEGGTVNKIIGLDGTSMLCFNGSRTLKALVRRHSGAHHVADDPVIQWQDPDQRTLTGPSVASYGNPPNSDDDDSFYDLQWGHDAIDAPEAWRKRRGAGVRVAIFDSGIDAEHPDLAPNLNAALSKSFVPGEDWNIQPGLSFNHGTHVAGTIAAADNGIGTIGIAPEAEIVALKVLSEFTGSGDFSWLMEAIIYAADNGVDVANMSLGALISKAGRSGSFGRELKEMLEIVGAYANAKGMTLIASAGNDAVNVDNGWFALPASAKHFISISATGPVGWALDPYTNLDNPSSYTNHGVKHIDFAAPGGDFIYPGNEACTVAGITNACWVFDMVFSTINEGWGWSAGTSMAAPHAAGVAALIKSWKKGATPAQVYNMLKASANKLGETPGKDVFFGRGRVNAVQAITLRRTKDNGVLAHDELVVAGNETPESFAIGQNYPNPFNPTTTFAFQLPEASDVHVAIYDMMGREVATLINNNLAAGSYEAHWNGQDTNGRSVASGVYVYKVEAGQFVASKVMTLLK